MALTNYTELKAAVASWLKDSSLTTQIVDFIALGEARISAELRVRAMETAGTLTTVAGTATVALPANFRAFKWLYVDGDPRRKLDVSSGEQIYQTYAGATTSKPALYSFSGDNLLLSPTPDSAYTLGYLAYIAPTPLSGSTATNTLFPRYAYLYLYAALIEAWNYLEDDAQVLKFEKLYQRFLTIARNEDEMDRHSGSTLVVRPGMRTP